MKSLYVMRHAKSSWKDPHLHDHQRPLNKRGQRNAVEMGQRLKTRGVRPDLLLSSDARRAMDTAAAVAGCLEMDAAAIRPEPALYEASADSILRVVTALNDRWERVMIFGHNPGFTEFTNRFYSHPLDNLPTAGIVELSFDVCRWREVDPLHLVAICLDMPKKR